MDAQIMKYIPESKKPAIKDAYRDSDGYWITLKEGWKVRDYYSERTIHEDSIKELRPIIKDIVRI